MANSHEQQHEWPLLEEYFPNERLIVYLKVAGDNRKVAYDLFIWNAKASAVFWELIGHVEIVIRGIIDKQLTHIDPDSDWVSGYTVFPSNDPIRKVIEIAQTRAGGRTTTIAHHQIVQQLPLGFIQVVLSKRYLRLWPSLASGFIGGNRGSFQELSHLMREFRIFRNRIGHHELLVNLDLRGIYQKTLRVAEIADPDFKAWLGEVTDVESILARKPGLD